VSHALAALWRQVCWARWSDRAFRAQHTRVPHTVVGVVVLEAFAGIAHVLPDHISLGRGALRRSSVCFDVTRGKGEGEWWRW